jgi:hypothetical protein
VRTSTKLEGALSKRIFVVLVLVGACGPTRGHQPGGDDDANGGGADAPACATAVVTAQKVPLDLFMMLDQSSSMSDAVPGGTKWQAVSTAVDTFVQQPNLDGVSVGLQYFGVPAGGATCSALFCTTAADCGPAACGPCIASVCTGAFTSAGDSCTAADYAHAAVEIAPLPGVASAITASIAAHGPSTSTPTSAALQGAVDHAQAWASTHANDAVAVVLATDGDPTECDTNLANIDAIAAAAAMGTPKILTFVIGVGSSLASLNGIAAAGGTASAFLVDTNANVNQQFLAAMNAIRGAALGCKYQIPTATGTPNYNEVNVVFTPGSGSSQTFPYVMSAASCPANGAAWYYDDPANPTQIILCPGACTAVQGDAMGSVGIYLGCATVIE